MLNVSPRTVASVKAIERDAPDLLPAMCERVQDPLAFYDGTTISYHGKPLTKCSRNELIDMINHLHTWLTELEHLAAQERRIDDLYAAHLERRLAQFQEARPDND